LSEDALEPVINMLSHLSQLNGKKVGVISHVEQLKQNIDSKILLTSEGAGAPTIVRID
jgi:DNA repair exonuclease SbcCD ATPase subunit